jgi:hypothetical protein
MIIIGHEYLRNDSTGGEGETVVTIPGRLDRFCIS